MTHYQCSKCGTHFERPGPKKPGRKIKCPKCGKVVYTHPTYLRRPEAPKIQGTVMDDHLEEKPR